MNDADHWKAHISLIRICSLGEYILLYILREIARGVALELDTRPRINKLQGTRWRPRANFMNDNPLPDGMVDIGICTGMSCLLNSE